MRSVPALLAFAASLVVAAAQPRDYLGAPCVGTTCDNGLQCLTLAREPCVTDESTFDDGLLCTCGGVGGESDPYFTGFFGQAFYFPAEAGTVYNIFSQETHLVNAHFVSTEMPEESDLLGLLAGARNSSFIGAVSIRRGDAIVEVSSDKKGYIAVKANGEDIPLGDPDTDVEVSKRLDGMTITIQKYQLPLLTEVHVETDLLCIGIMPEMEHKDNMGNLVRGHLSLQMNLKNALGSVPQAHGILGQTADPLTIADEPDVFPGEGEPQDYVVSSLDSHDFAYDLFQKPAAKPTAVLATRRMLGSKSQTLSAAVDSQWSSFRRAAAAKH